MSAGRNPTLSAPAPATLGERTDAAGTGPRPRRALLISAAVHLAALAAVALVLDGPPQHLPEPMPVELVTPTEVAARVRQAGKVLPDLPPLNLPTTQGSPHLEIGLGLAQLGSRLPSVPVRIRPPRLTALTSQGLRAPDLPPPIPAMEGYDLESSLVRADGAPVAATAIARSHPDNPAPLYPDSAKRLGLQGEAVVRVTVTPDGQPESLILVESSGWSVLDDAALETVRTWRFVPGRRDGTDIRSTIELPIVFSLENG